MTGPSLAIRIQPAQSRQRRDRMGRSAPSPSVKLTKVSCAPSRRSDFLLEQWERPRDNRRQGRQSMGKYSVSRIDIRADNLLISADPDVRGQADYETSRMQITRFGVT